MLYVSTRNKTDSFTAYRAVHENQPPDGGMFVPFRLPQITEAELEALRDKNFSETVAELLNIFFSHQLSGWDVEFCIGRYPFKLRAMNQKITIAELWHNTESCYAYMVECLYKRFNARKTECEEPTQWFKIAVEIAVLFGLYGEFNRNGIKNIDIAVNDDDYLHLISAWYARQMGLPVTCIICGCNKNGNMWDFLHRGEISLHESGATASVSVLGISVPECLERLIYSIFGRDEVIHFLNACQNHGTYQLPEGTLDSIKNGMFAAVIGTTRVDSVISSIYRTNAYLADPRTAISYGALQDYRAQSGENRHTLILSGYSPILSAERMAYAMGCSQEELKAMIHLSKE